MVLRYHVARLKWMDIMVWSMPKNKQAIKQSIGSNTLVVRLVKILNQEDSKMSSFSDIKVVL